MKEKITESEAIEIARELFVSPEAAACDQALDAYDKALDAYDKALDVCYKARDACDKALDVCFKARDAYEKALAACFKARDACAATIKGYKIVFVHNENRAFNIAAKDYDGVYCFALNRRELWRYPGEECPDPNTVEKIEWRAK